MFRQGFTCPALLDFTYIAVSCTGLSPATADLSRSFHYNNIGLRADPRSLAATDGISIDVFSCGYLDVSVLRVRFAALCIQTAMTHAQSTQVHFHYCASMPLRGQKTED